MENFVNEYKNEIKIFKEFIEVNIYSEKDLVMVLHKAQEVFGYLPKEVQKIVAEELKVPLSKVYGVVTFYSYFTMKKKGKYNISVCTGTACFVKGAKKLSERITERLNIKVGETSKDGMFSFIEARCVGACGLAPVVIVNNEVYGKVNTKMLDEILDKYTQEAQNENN